MVRARHLHNIGINVIVVTSRPGTDFSHIPAQQLEIVQKLQIPIFNYSNFDKSSVIDLIIDGLIGYSLKGPPRAFCAAHLRRPLRKACMRGFPQGQIFVITPKVKSDKTRHVRNSEQFLPGTFGILNSFCQARAEFCTPPGVQTAQNSPPCWQRRDTSQMRWNRSEIENPVPNFLWNGVLRQFFKLDERGPTYAQDGRSFRLGPLPGFAPGR